jgi:hypothetical protein
LSIASIFAILCMFYSLWSATAGSSLRPYKRDKFRRQVKDQGNIME